MRIKWYGQSFFRIVLGGRDGARIVVDPFSSDCGLRTPSLKAHFLLVSHPDYNNPKAVKGDPFVVDAPGEYNVKETFVKGVPALGRDQEKITMFRIEGEGYSVVHLGDLNQEELSSDQVESLGMIDVLLIPIGGEKTIGPSQASKMVTQLEPKAVIPMQYQIPDLDADLAELDDFLDAMGEDSVEAQEQFKVKPTNLPDDGAEIAVLKPSH